MASRARSVPVDPAAHTWGRSGFVVFVFVFGLRLRRRQREGSGQQAHQASEGRSEPALAPGKVGLVGEGLAEHADDQRRHDVDRVLVVGVGTELAGGDGVGQRAPLQVDHLHARGERFLGGVEARDRPPEQQLGHGAVAQRPAPARLEAGDQRVQARLGLRHARAHLGQVLELAPQEQRVVDGHERREVLVERRGLDPEAARHLGQAQPVDALLGHDLPGDVEDLLDRLLAPPRPTIGPGTGVSASRGLRRGLTHLAKCSKRSS